MTNDELSKLSPGEKRIRIAEKCGWKFNQRLEHRMIDEVSLVTRPPGGGWVNGLDTVPNYLNDLNAMVEAEKTLSPHAQWVYLNCLAGIIRPGAKLEDMPLFLPFATAAQRADALLLTVGQRDED